MIPYTFPSLVRFLELAGGAVEGATSLEPLVFEPYLRPQVWGGRSLQSLFSKSLPDAATYGESWELSTHPHHVSRVAEGPFRGASLDDLCRQYSKELLGTDRPAAAGFPLLVKLLDCRELLSIQVHPDDRLAGKLRPGERGKTEAWVVLAVEPTGRIFAGLKRGVGRGDLERHLANGTTDQCLHAFQPKVGDCVFIPAGTVHAVGGGVVMAEIQQSSDVTFRLFDWNRLGTDGKPRALHIAESLAAIDFSRGPVGPVIPQPRADVPGPSVGETLVVCPYFAIERYQLAAALPVTGHTSVWMVLSGSANLNGASFGREFHAGETVLIPDTSAPLQWQPKRTDSPATLLRAVSTE